MPRGRVTYSSPAAERVFGSPQGTMQGESVFDAVHPDDLGPTAEAFLRLASAEPGATSCAEFRMRHVDGTWRTIEALGTNRVDDPAVGGVVISSRDITDRVEAERAVREGEERYRLLVELSPTAIAVHQQGRFVYLNPAAMSMFGARSQDELLGRSVLDVVHPDNAQMVATRLTAVKEGEELALREERLLRLDGETIDAEVVGVPFTFAGSPAVL